MAVRDTIYKIDTMSQKRDISVRGQPLGFFMVKIGTKRDFGLIDRQRIQHAQAPRLDQAAQGRRAMGDKLPLMAGEDGLIVSHEYCAKGDHGKCCCRFPGTWPPH